MFFEYSNYAATFYNPGLMDFERFFFPGGVSAGPGGVGAYLAGQNPCALVELRVDEEGGGIAWMDSEVQLERLS